MHACGMATDYAQLQCIRRSVPYLLVPCCVGKINIDVSLAAGSRYAYPYVRSIAGKRPKSFALVESNCQEVEIIPCRVRLSRRLFCFACDVFLSTMRLVPMQATKAFAGLTRAGTDK